MVSDNFLVLSSGHGAGLHLEQVRRQEMKKEDEERKVIKLRVITFFGIVIYLILAWACIISILIRTWNVVGAIDVTIKIYFLIGFICGLLCSLMAIHKQDMDDFLKGKLE